MWLVILTIAAIPVGTRMLVGVMIPGFHEYEAVFLYCADILVVLLVVFNFRRLKSEIEKPGQGLLNGLMFVFLLASATSIFSAPSAWLAVYSIIRLVILVAFAYSIGLLASVEKVFRTILAVIAVVAVLEAGIGVAQFSLQGDVGLGRFGEPYLVSYEGSASTIRINSADPGSFWNGRFLRVYGTFPHPNIFAGFLSLGLLALLYWYIWCERQLWGEIPWPKRALVRKPKAWLRNGEWLKALNSYLTNRYFYRRLLIAAATFVVVLGLTLSFSRSGWLAAGAGLIILFSALMRHFPGAVVRAILMVSACGAVSYGLFGPLVLPRTQLATGQPAVSDRLQYLEVGRQAFLESPFGVGIGNQVLHSVRSREYQHQGMMNVWNWEPVHNLYLLILVEVGMLGLLSFLAFLAMVAWRLSRVATPAGAVVLAMLASLMTIGLFDHFLWTLQPGRLMLWLVIGLCLSQLPHSKKDRAIN